tara:strand:- start:1650 stop:2132 length:483 start_codon:yes stop_codon:yes gene_type:complete
MNVEPKAYRPNVGIMLVNAQNKVFVGQRLDRFTNAWQMPQGGIDEGEDSNDAVFRELLEETGVTENLVRVEAISKEWIYYDFPEDIIDELWSGKYKGQRQRYYLMRFFGQDDQINIDTKEPEFSDWKWIDLDDLLDNIVAFKRDVYQQVIAEFKKYLKPS